jgi:hypothetical protein
MTRRALIYLFNVFDLVFSVLSVAAAAEVVDASRKTNTKSAHHDF